MIQHRHAFLQLGLCLLGMPIEQRLHSLEMQPERVEILDAPVVQIARKILPFAIGEQQLRVCGVQRLHYPRLCLARPDLHEEQAGGEQGQASSSGSRQPGPGLHRLRLERGRAPGIDHQPTIVETHLHRPLERRLGRLHGAGQEVPGISDQIDAFAGAAGREDFESQGRRVRAEPFQ